MDELTLDELGECGGDRPAVAQPPATYLDFFAELGPKSAKERAALIWRMPKDSAVTVDDNL